MTTVETVILGKALRDLRTRAALTQAEVAASAEIDPPYLSRVEAGVRDLRWSTVLRILDAIGADLRQLADAVERAKRDL